MIHAEAALEELREGNRRFVANEGKAAKGRPARRDEVVGVQNPIAVVLGCSDSRVPPELVFDQDLGDLFVVRVAGNVLGPAQVGSLDFAVDALGVRLVVVLGHSGCGAVKAAVEEHTGVSGPASPNLNGILEMIRSSVEDGPSREGQSRMASAVRANVRASVEALRGEAGPIQRLIQDAGLLVVGAEYSLETGVVDFFDGVPGAVEEGLACG